MLVSWSLVAAFVALQVYRLIKILKVNDYEFMEKGLKVEQKKE